MNKIVMLMSDLAEELLADPSSEWDPMVKDHLDALLDDPTCDFPEFHSELSDYDTADAWNYWKDDIMELPIEKGNYLIKYIKKYYGK